MTNDTLIDLITRGDDFAAWDAAERYRKVPRDEDLPGLITAYETRTSVPGLKYVAIRMEIIDLISLVGTPEASEFLKLVARSRASHYVRYDAMRGLIELGYQDWRPGKDSPKKLRSGYYASLLTYEKYRKREIDFDTMRAIAQSETDGRGDFWEWMTHLEPMPATTG